MTGEIVRFSPTLEVDGGYSGPGWFPLRTLTSGIRAKGWRNLEYLRGHMVTGEPVNVYGWSHGLCVAGELDSGPGERLLGDHMGCM